MLTDEQVSRISRLQRIFADLHPSFSTLKKALRFFTSSTTHPEAEIVRWEMISLAYRAELCLYYETKFINASKKMMNDDPGLVDRILKDGGGGGSVGGLLSGTGTSAGSLKKPYASKVGAKGSRTTGSGDQSEPVDIDDNEDSDVELSKLSESMNNTSLDSGNSASADSDAPSENFSRFEAFLRNSGSNNTNAPAGSPTAVRFLLLPSRDEDPTTGRWVWKTQKAAPTAAPNTSTTNIQQQQQQSLKSRRRSHPSSTLSTIKSPQNQTSTPSNESESSQRQPHQPQPQPKPVQPQETPTTRCLLVPESDIQNNPTLSILCDHGEIFAELWKAYNNIPSPDIETLHNILESITTPPRLYIPSINERRLTLDRYLHISVDDFDNSSGGVGDDRIRGNRIGGGQERMIRDLFTTDRFGGQTDVWIFSFIFWRFVWVVHGERLQEERMVAREGLGCGTVDGERSTSPGEER
ncbi:hypothetical protein HDU76_013786 [Blyttiomyces sp. JEL0837]|nr:hypothetical protein HDU76_013786 [Blyttiomyces sp. JEL0837]